MSAMSRATQCTNAGAGSRFHRNLLSKTSADSESQRVEMHVAALQFFQPKAERVLGVKTSNTRNHQQNPTLTMRGC